TDRTVADLEATHRRTLGFHIVRRCGTVRPLQLRQLDPRRVQFLLDRADAEGVWEEKYSTGTGFPGHFYIRYHGYRYYFPLLALARYQKAVDQKSK
ncbi:MAG: hypothetical protein HY877_01765, partial [Deltaproteobacteria bacterium]|nr:hypothetical protein [Deltaproteobacteria bacterium]